jgi:uncharacterized membrane protein
MTQFLTIFTVLDLVAVTILMAVWVSITRLIEHPPKWRPSTSVLMAAYRREWMRQMIFRDPRILDAQMAGILRQGTAFFASASMISIGGGFALIGNTDVLQGLAKDLTLDGDPVVVLKFVWAHRLFGYFAVILASVPVSHDDPRSLARAKTAGEISVAAARSYNRGLRSVYFGIAAAAWLVGAPALIIATVFTMSVIMRREFASHSRTVLLNTTDGVDHTTL